MKELVKLKSRPNRKRTSCTYYLHYSQDGERIRDCLHHGDGKLAEKQRLVKDIQLQGLDAYIRGRRLRLSDLCECYLEATLTLASSTRSLCRTAFGALIAAVNDRKIRTFEYAHAQRFQRHVRKSGLTETTANVYCKAVRPAFRWAMRSKILFADPFDGLKMFTEVANDIRILEPLEFEGIFDAAAGDIWRARLLAGKTAGLRRGEVLNLVRTDVDFRRDVITVQAKGETASTWRWVPKDKERRRVPLIADLKVLLVRIAGELPDDQPYLLLTPARYEAMTAARDVGRLSDGMRRCPDNNFSRTFRDMCSRAKVSGVTFHDLRRTCITEWYEAGLEWHEGMKLAGHSDVKTTIKYYVASRDTLVDKARRASQKMLRKKVV